MSDKDKFVEAVGKLIELTQQGRLRWRVGDKSGLPADSDDAAVDSVFIAAHLDRQIRIFRVRSRIEDSSVTSSYTRVFNPRRQYITSVKLQLLDNSGNVVWRFPASPANADLMKAVEYQVSGVEEFIDGLLRE